MIRQPCGFLTAGAEDATALAQAFSEDQIIAFAQNVVDNRLIDCLKDTNVTSEGVVVVQEASRQHMQDIYDAVLGRPEFLVPWRN